MRLNPNPSQIKNLELLIEASESRRKNDYKKAISLYKQALTQDKTNVDLHVIIALAHFFLAGNPNENGENYQAAVTWVEKAISLEPNNARLYNLLGDSLWIGLLEYERAAIAYRKAIELNPQLVEAYLGLSSIYGPPESVVSLDEAINALQIAAQMRPDDPNLLGRLADLLFEAHRNLEAEREWCRALMCSQPLSEGYINALRNEIKGLGRGE